MIDVDGRSTNDTFSVAVEVPTVVVPMVLRRVDISSLYLECDRTGGISPCSYGRKNDFGLSSSK